MMPQIGLSRVARPPVPRTLKYWAGIDASPKPYITPSVDARPVPLDTPGVDASPDPIVTPTGNRLPLDLNTPAIDASPSPTTHPIQETGADPLYTYIGELAKGWRSYPGVETPEGKYVPEGAFTRLADKKVRKEISDEGAEYRPGRFSEKAGLRENIFGPVEAVLDHEELFKNYPEFKRYGFGISKQNLKGTAHGQFDPMGYNVDVSPEVAYGLESGKSVLLHELQHAIQEKEGFARGGSPGEFVRGYKSIQRDLEDQLDAINSQLSQAVGTPRYNDLLETRDYISKEYRNLMGDHHLGPLERGHDDYKSLAGEVESRDVQSRMNMPMSERLKSQPYQSQGIPVNRQIVRYGGGKSERRYVAR